MLFPDKKKVQDLFRDHKAENPFEGQEKQLSSLLKKSLSLSNSGKHLEAIDEYYSAWNFFESFKDQEPAEKRAGLRVKLISVHKRIFEEIAKEINLCCAGNRYNKAMYLYELLRIFHDKSRRYLEYEKLQDFFKRMQSIYNSMVSIYKLHNPKGGDKDQRS